ncbi:hypothetical protein P4Q63_005307 [Salmonella enterica]|nr:hypothetical protein [Salmonella enterica]EKQ0893662.1 hypothetical protein [Salmonella enterica]
MSKYILTEENGVLDLELLDDTNDNNEIDDLIKRRKSDVLKSIIDWINTEKDFLITKGIL